MFVVLDVGFSQGGDKLIFQDGNELLYNSELF